MAYPDDISELLEGRDNYIFITSHRGQTAYDFNGNTEILVNIINDVCVADENFKEIMIALSEYLLRNTNN